MDAKHRWRVQNTRMQTGYVPSNYVRKEKPSIFDSIKKKVCFLMKKGTSCFTFFFYPRWRVAGTKAQEAELSPPQTQVLCTVFPLPLIQVRSSSFSYKWARSSSFFMNLLSNVTLYYVQTATDGSFLHNTQAPLSSHPPSYSPPPQIGKIFILILKHHYIFNPPSPPHSLPPQYMKAFQLEHKKCVLPINQSCHFWVLVLV